MDLIYLGKFVNTHGLNGEIRMISDFEYKKDVFNVGNYLYIDNKKYTIKSYRSHKNYDMVTLNNIESINDIEKYKGYDIYIDKNDYSFKYVYNDLIGFDIYMNNLHKGKVVEVLKSKLYPLIKVSNNDKFYLVPYTNVFVNNIDFENKIIIINSMKGLLDED